MPPPVQAPIRRAASSNSWRKVAMPATGAPDRPTRTRSIPSGSKSLALRTISRSHRFTRFRSTELPTLLETVSPQARPADGRGRPERDEVPGLGLLAPALDPQIVPAGAEPILGLSPRGPTALPLRPLRRRYGHAVAALVPPSLQDGVALPGAVALAEAVGAVPADFLGLVRALHGGSSLRGRAASDQSHRPRRCQGQRNPGMVALPRDAPWRAGAAIASFR